MHIEVTAIIHLLWLKWKFLVHFYPQSHPVGTQGFSICYTAFNPVKSSWTDRKSVCSGDGLINQLQPTLKVTSYQCSFLLHSLRIDVEMNLKIYKYFHGQISLDCTFYAFFTLRLWCHFLMREKWVFIEQMALYPKDLFWRKSLSLSWESRTKTRRISSI